MSKPITNSTDFKLAICNFTTEDSITLYWDKPQDFRKGDYYKIDFNKQFVYTTDKTHFEMDGLKANTPYSIQIQWLRTGHTENSICHQTILLNTQKEKQRLDITKAPYFAIGDGQTMNTQAIQHAIDDCKENQKVYIPKGIYRTGSLRLHSNMELYLESEAVLQGTDNPNDYLPKIQSRFEGIELMCYSSLLNLGTLDHKSGFHCENVIIRGNGTIASGGKRLAEKIIAQESSNLKNYLTSLGDKINEYEKPETIPGRVRPRLINMSNCKNIILSGLTLKNGASWNVHMIYSKDIVTNNCTFYSKDVWNGDGWNPDSSSDCTIFHCVFYTGDDSISIKSGRNPQGNQINRPCKNIRIFDCQTVLGHGITIGSELSGGIKNISIWDCDITCSTYGIEIKGTKKRGGYVRNVHVRDCCVPRILFHSVSYNDDGISAGAPPIFETCYFENLHILGNYMEEENQWTACQAIELSGFDEPEYELQHIIFKNITLGYPGQKQRQMIALEYCRNITLENISSLD